jgi:hypothetical protein
MSALGYIPGERVQTIFQQGQPKIFLTNLNLSEEYHLLGYDAVYSVELQLMILFITIAVKTSNPTKFKSLKIIFTGRPRIYKIKEYF